MKSDILWYLLQSKKIKNHLKESENRNKAKNILKIRSYFALCIHIYIGSNNIIAKETYPVHEQWKIESF